MNLRALRVAPLALSLALASVAAFADGVPIPAPGDSGKVEAHLLDAKTADTFLKPGDFLLKIYGGKTHMTGLKQLQAVQIAAQKLMKKMGKLRGDAAWKRADPEIVHGGIYVGGGTMAEADAPGIIQQSLDESTTFRFYVYRMKDEALRSRAVEIAKRWANGRMKYLPPVTVVGSSSFGPHARAETLEYVRAAETAGGPPEKSRMFCIQFMVAVYQAAVGSLQLAQNPHLGAGDLRMPYALEHQGTNLTPAHLDGILREAVEGGRDRAWEYVGVIAVK